MKAGLPKRIDRCGKGGEENSGGFNTQTHMAMETEFYKVYLRKKTVNRRVKKNTKEHVMF